MFAAFYNKEEVAKRYFARVDKRSWNVARKTYGSDSNVLVAWGKNGAWGCYVPNAQFYVSKGIMAILSC